MPVSQRLIKFGQFGHISLVMQLFILLLSFTIYIEAANVNSTLTGSTTSTPTTVLAAEPRVINPNITILHEVHEEGFSTKKDKPLIPDILPLKTLKKKPYLPLEKPLNAYEKPKPLKELDLHPVVFDFNLGDLEDLEHETFKKKDLSAEEKLLLRDVGLDNLEAISTLTYSDDVKTPDAETLQDDLSVQVEIVTTTTEHALNSPTYEVLSNNLSSTSTSMTTSTSSLITENHSTTTTSTTMSPHILKIFKTKSSKKGRELLKHEDLPKGPHNHNSLQHYAAALENINSTQTDESLQNTNVFQLLTNLFDHFYWQSSEIRNRVSTGCGLEMQAYLTALHGNYRWAQGAYDSSGHYRGQVLYGNENWLGQMEFCYELNRQLDPEKRKHFEFSFFTTEVALKLNLPDKLQVILTIGECLPKSCTANDIQHIMDLDPHGTMLSSTLNGTQSGLYKILRVRNVPGLYSNWRDIKFQVLASFMLTLLFLIIVATWYQSHLTQLQLKQPPIAVISGSKVDTSALPHISSTSCDNGKSFELYQMSSLNENNNIANDQEAESNRKVKSSYFMENHQLDNNSQRNGSSQSGTNGSQRHRDVEYHIENLSSNGAQQPYESKKKLSLHERLLLCFAFQTNANTILNVETAKEIQTSCLHGLRVISVLWTIMVHTYLQMFKIGENRYKRVLVERSPWYQIVGNASFSVDTFFFISGLLVTLLSLKQDKKLPERTAPFVKKGLKDTVIVVVYRYIRLTPAYLFVIFFNHFSLRQAVDKSVFQPKVGEDVTCGLYWWRNILYINNFYPLSEICMIWSWYMANDMQFFIMATLLLVLATRYPKLIVLTICSFLISSWGISGVISLRYHYTHKVSQPFESFDFLYDKPWQRVGPYIVGMLTGYIIYKVRTPPKVSGRVNALLWSLSLGLLMLIIFGVWQHELNVVSTAFYVSIAHTAFAGSLIWIVLSCCWGLTPTMNRILSYRCLWPLSRLTYCTYLIHPIISLITAYHMQGTIHLDNAFIIVIFMGNAVVSFIVAFFISVAFEAPTIKLLKILFHK